MNKAGRTVVHLRASNVVDALAQPFAVRYRLPPLAWAREPALWGASLAAILALLVTARCLPGFLHEDAGFPKFAQYFCSHAGILWRSMLASLTSPSPGF